MLRALLAEDVNTVFAYPGGSIIKVFDALYDHQKDLKQILVRHEQGATHAAQGYARVSGRTGVAIVTSGPGATNTITGISDAMLDSTPIVVIAGQVGTDALGTDAFQEIDLVGVTQPITKWSYQIRRAQDIPWAVARAFYIAGSGRPGPVVLDFTKTAQMQQIDFKPAKIDYVRSYIPSPDPIESQINDAVQLIDSAKKPLVLVGHGVELGNAEKELAAFIEKGDLPAARTLLGLSALPSDHPLNMGMLGMHGNLAPNTAVAKPAAIAEEVRRFEGTAICFSGEDEATEAISRRLVKPGHVVVIRYAGPKGAPGMPEMFKPMKLLYGQGLNKCTALITDGRFSGTNNGCFVGHISPEAADGGPIALVRDGDKITIDVYEKKLELHVSDEELARRRAEWTYTPPTEVPPGYLRRYAKLVSSANKGAIME